MATNAWRGEEFRRPTTFQDLQAIAGCSTRLAILVALSGGPMHVTDLRHALGYGQSLLSNHFKVLRQTGIADYEGEGVHHIYRLLGRARIVVTEVGITFRITANDGGVLAGEVPSASPFIRLLEKAIAASKLPRGPSPGPAKKKRRPRRRKGEENGDGV